jgi:ABC-type glycerol-3-phosphate transport system substrate-binding protein
VRLTQRGLLLPLVLGLTVAACSGGGGSTSSPVAAATSQGAPAASAPASPAATSDPSTGTTGSTVVIANTASVEELQAAFEAEGITNADKWAREVAEYRPYPADPTWAQLRRS